MLSGISGGGVAKKCESDKEEKFGVAKGAIQAEFLAKMTSK